MKRKAVKPVKISTKGRYGLRMMIDIAMNQNEGPVSVRDIARRQSLSDKYLEQIITQANKAGLLKSIRGAGGGYQLSRLAKDISCLLYTSSYMAVDRSDVCVIVIDATEGFTEQDSKVAGYAHEQGKGCIIAVNKWDAVEKDGKTMQEFTKKLQNDFSFMSYAPFLFISAKTGQRVEKLYELIHYVGEQNAMRIPTGRLNDMLSYATARVQPPSDKGKRLRIFYMTQASTKPPTFVIFVNSKELFHFSYQRYLENQIRETFHLDGTPIRMIVRERGEK